MATKTQYIRHIFGGGFTTDLGPNADLVVDQTGQILIPFLVDAENLLFEFDGGPHKMPGTAKLNSSQMESGAVVKGLFDYWDTGTGSGSTQHRIVHVGTTIKRDDADGTFTNLFTGLQSGAVANYSVLEDLLIMATDHVSDVPKSWDGTTAQNLAGSPPNFAFSETHKNRSWAAGVEANSSRLYYSALLKPADWIGAGSGKIDIDPADGDRITAIASHRDELWVFKGPYKGSIHRITGSAPTGSDPFARTTFTTGVGAVGQNSLFRFADDLGFMWSDGSVRSLGATEKFGDFLESALSRPINVGFMNQRLNISRLKHAWAAVDDIRGLVVITLPIDSSTNNNAVLAMDFRFNPVRWSFLSGLAAGCIASVIDQTNNDRRIIMLGGNDGHVRKWGQATRTNDGTGINYKWTTPVMSYGSPVTMKTISVAAIGLQPKGNTNITFGWTRDNNAQQTQTVTQGGGSLLDSFTLDTDSLGGGQFIDRFLELEEGGEFRSIQYQVIQSANNEDVEIHSFTAGITAGSVSTEN